MRVRTAIARIVALVSGALVCVAAPALAQPPAPTMNPGGVIEVSIYAAGEKQDSYVLEVAEDSTVTVPLLGRRRVVGMSGINIGRTIQNGLANGFYKDPQVIVNVKEYGGQVYVFGEVRNPGVYSLDEVRSVLAACLKAGGFTDFASKKKTKINRTSNGKTQVLKVDLGKVSQGKAPDLALRNGDRVEVPRRAF
jgi:polysaccharide export outer membrane protein